MRSYPTKLLHLLLPPHYNKTAVYLIQQGSRCLICKEFSGLSYRKNEAESGRGFIACITFKLNHAEYEENKQ